MPCQPSSGCRMGATPSIPAAFGNESVNDRGMMREQRENRRVGRERKDESVGRDGGSPPALIGRTVETEGRIGYEEWCANEEQCEDRIAVCKLESSARTDNHKRCEVRGTKMTERCGNGGTMRGQKNGAGIEERKGNGRVV